MAKLRKTNTPMKELFHKVSYSIPSHQTLSHLSHHSSRYQLIPISPFNLAYLLDCVNLSSRFQILPSLADMVSSLNSDLVILLISATPPRFGTDSHLLKISFARSSIYLWIISRLRIRISTPWIPLSCCLSIYCSVSLLSFILPRVTKAQVHISF